MKALPFKGAPALY